MKYNDYEIELTFEQAKQNGHIVSLADSQMLRSIRDIRRRDVDTQRIEKWFALRDTLRRRLRKAKITPSEYKLLKFIRHHQYIQGYPHVRELMDKLNNPGGSIYDQLEHIQSKIDRTMYVPDYVTIVMENTKHYERMFIDGVKINGCVYRRLSCSAGQARVSTVVFCNTEIIEELQRRLNNGRHMDCKVAPSKFNAYFGLAGSATYRVSEPRFIVVKDFENEDTFEANYVTETDYDIDDIVEQRIVTLPMNRTDGMGLISPEQAARWSAELGLDYIPSQFGVRQSFLKGMVCTFPFVEFCADVNDGNYLVDTIYKDESGNYIKADLRNVDVIITESQFKLWNAYSSAEEYIQNYRANKLYWGVPQYSPKVAKDILKMNYMFLQTLNLNSEDIEGLASQFVEWIQGVSYDNFAYTLLFLLGVNNTEDSIKDFIKHSDNYWIKALILCPELRKDKYFCSKIRDLIKNKIQNGCMGQIIVDGNFQTLVSDPYGMMQHVCGLPVTGLLGPGEFYSNYWNEKGIDRVDGMRSPLTFRSEHVVLDLVKNDQTEKWYRYCKLGIILNYHGHEVCNFGGADFDLDILATTSNPYIINGVYTDELTVTYNVPVPEKKIPNELDLYHSDLFSFGSIIGQITNKSSNAYALLPVIEAQYGKDSEEYRLTYSRLKQCCKAQSAQIDKAKIGRNVKGIPKSWLISNKSECLTDYEQACDHVLLNQYPYFFRYRYDDCNRKYQKYIYNADSDCIQQLHMHLNELLGLTNHDKSQEDFISNYYKYMPVTLSQSSVNMLCRYIEQVDFNIKSRIKASGAFDTSILKSDSVHYSSDEYESVVNALRLYIKTLDNNSVAANKSKLYESMTQHTQFDDTLKSTIRNVCPNILTAINCLIDYAYSNNSISIKSKIWNTYGGVIVSNIIDNIGDTALFPFPDPDGDIAYLGQQYKLKEISIV